MTLADLFALTPEALEGLEVNPDPDDRCEHEITATLAIREVGVFINAFHPSERSDYASDTLRRIAEILNRAAVIAARTR
jgi:hypothetical protein